MAWRSTRGRRDWCRSSGHRTGPGDQRPQYEYQRGHSTSLGHRSGPLSARVLGGECKTSKSRLRRGLVAVAQWCRANRHHANNCPATHSSQKSAGTLHTTGSRATLMCCHNSGGVSSDSEEMAWPTPPRRRSLLGANVSTAGTVSASTSDRRPLGVPSRSEQLKRGAVCVNCASTDLWGTRVGDHPGLPSVDFSLGRNWCRQKLVSVDFSLGRNWCRQKLVSVDFSLR